MHKITIKNKAGETLEILDAFTPRECEALHILGHVAGHDAKLLDVQGFAGCKENAEIKGDLVLTVSELRKVQNTPERIAKAIAAGYSFIVAKGQDRYTPSVRKYDVYIGANDARIVSQSQKARDMGGDVWNETETVFEMIAGKAGGRVYDFEALTAADAAKYRFDSVDAIDEKIEKLRSLLGRGKGNPAFLEALERAKADGFEYVHFCTKPHESDRIAFVTDRVITPKPETAARRNLCKAIKAAAGIELNEWQIENLEKAGYKIVKARKAAKAGEAR